MTSIEQVQGDDPRVVECLLRTFVDGVDRQRLPRTRAWLAIGEQQRPVGCVVAEPMVDHWYLWLMAVDASNRRHGIGRRLLHCVQQAAKEKSALFIGVKTYRQWPAMEALLLSEGWGFSGSVSGSRYDGIAENWIRPLPSRPCRAVLIGANPNGRGGEIATAMAKMPDVWQVVAVVDRDTSVLSGWRGVVTGRLIDEVLGRVDADAAVLALPHSEYEPIRSACMNRGLAIFHEKPLACSMSEVCRLQEELGARPTSLMVGVQRRSHPTYFFLRQALKEDCPDTLCIHMSLGRRVQSSSRSAETTGTADWRSSVKAAGGGAIVDIGYHAIDLAHFLTEASLSPLSCVLWNGDRPAYLDEPETAATIIGRCGRTWVKIRVDREGTKDEYVSASGRHLWHVTRKEVTKDGQLVFQAEDNWVAALAGRLADLAIACITRKRTLDLWEHLSTLRVIEQARSVATASGLGIRGGFHG